jgi:hypothetical protein
MIRFPPVFFSEVPNLDGLDQEGLPARRNCSPALRDGMNLGRW